MTTHEIRITITATDVQGFTSARDLADRVKNLILDSLEVGTVSTELLSEPEPCASCGADCGCDCYTRD